MVEEKYIDIYYIWSEANPADIMTKITSKKYFVSYMKSIVEVELRELVDTGRQNVMKTIVTDDVITHDKTEYSSHALAEVVDGENRNEWVFITRSRTGK